MAGRLARGMAEFGSCRDLRELEERFVHGALELLPGDCLAWNNWAPDWSALQSGRLNAPYEKEFLDRLEAFHQTVDHHPVVLAGRFQSSAERVVKLTDFQSAAGFRDNPLYREVYRHLDSRYQIAFTPCHLTDRRVLLTLNRRLGDFSRVEEEVLHFTGRCLDGIARAIERKGALDDAWRELRGFIGGRGSADGFETLGPGELGLLGELLRTRSVSAISRARGVRRDSVDRRMGAIREKLGLENNRQLLSALADLRAEAAGRRQGGA